MQETQGTLMAAWRASGGALDAMAAQAEAGDDGLMAMTNTRFISCFGADDGLAAAGITRNGFCNADDGLATGTTLGPPICVADDGLTATAMSHRWPYCLAQ